MSETNSIKIIVGVDTHKDIHAAVAINEIGARLGALTIPVAPKADPRDSQVILHMLRIGATQCSLDPLKAGINDVQELSKTHEAIAKAKTEIQHRILTQATRNRGAPPQCHAADRSAPPYARPPALSPPIPIRPAAMP